jgi:predicted DNA-binding protein (MmcQ/YjbR family)
MTLRDYCLSKKGTSEDFPFGDDTRVLRVMGKLFALMPVGAHPARMNLKCDPAWALVLRETYPSITAGYHMNKAHWNTITADGTIPEDLVYEMIDHSYSIVVKGLPKHAKEQLAEM